MSIRSLVNSCDICSIFYFFAARHFVASLVSWVGTWPPNSGKMTLARSPQWALVVTWFSRTRLRRSQDDWSPFSTTQGTRQISISSRGRYRASLVGLKKRRELGLAQSLAKVGTIDHILGILGGKGPKCRLYWVRFSSIYIVWPRLIIKLCGTFGINI